MADLPGLRQDITLTRVIYCVFIHLFRLGENTFSPASSVVFLMNKI